MKNKLNKNTKVLMSCDLINNIVSLFGDTFLVAYFLQISNENIVQVSMWYIVVYSLLGLGSLILGYFIKKHPKQIVNIYKIGIAIKSIYILSILLINQNINQYFILIAMFYGIAEALYWTSHDIMSIEMAENQSRKKYMTTKRMLGKLISIVVPFILGISIELSSFINVAIYIFILTLIQIIILFFIKQNETQVKNKEEKYSLRNYLNNVSVDNKKKLNKLYKVSFLYGIMMDNIRVVIIIIIIMTFKTTLDLGILTTIFSICSIISLYIFNKFYKTIHIKRTLIWCSLLICFSIIGLLFDINKVTLIIYNFIYAITICILEVMFKIKSENIIRENSMEKWVVEYHTFLEGFMDLGRICGFLLLMTVGFMNNILYFKILLLILTLSIPIYAITMFKIEKDNYDTIKKY